MFTTVPADGAALVRTTEQVSEVIPTMMLLLQNNPFSAVVFVVPEPLRFTTVVAPAEELLLKVTAPATSAALAGVNRTISVACCPGDRVMGKVIPDIEKPAPVTDAEVIVKGAVPVELSSTLCGAVPTPTVSVPNATLLALTPNVAAEPFSVSVALFEICAAVAVRVAATVELTGEVFAVNCALVAFPGTVTMFGITIAELLLDSFTPSPALGAAALICTVQVVLAVPVSDAVAQLSPVKRDGCSIPAPLTPIAMVPAVADVLLTVTFPLTAPVAVGSN